jgi:hypothetical protein
MTYRVIQAHPMLACDTYGGVPSAEAAHQLALDFGAVGLYPAVTTSEELAWVTDAGMGVWWILEGLAATTTPTAAIGQAIAENAVRRLTSFGVPAGATVFVDLEDASGPVSGKNEGWIALADAAATVLTNAGHICGVYVGVGLGLDAAQLYDLKATRYWRSASRVLEPACGYCLEQGRPVDVKHPSGVQIDYDAIWEDFRGRTISLVVAG